MRAGMSLGQAEAGNPPTSQDGAFVMGGQRYVGRDYYVYDALANPLPNGGAAVDNIQIQADADFIWQKATYLALAATPANLAADTRIIPAATVQLTDTASGRELFEQALPIDALFGTGELPFILPTARLLPARSTFRVNFQNLGTTPMRIQLCMIGYKAYIAS